MHLTENFLDNVFAVIIRMFMLLKKRSLGKIKDLSVIAARSMGDAYVKKERKTSFPKSQQKQCRKN